jgi:hypothetical protein
LTSLVARRRLFLYLLALAAMESAQIAWGRPGPARLLGDALALALTLVLGEAVADAFSGAGAASWRRRARLGTFALYSVLAAGALSAAVAGAELAERASLAMGLVQLILFVTGDLLGLRPIVLANLLLLAVIAALAGGLPAAVAMIGTVGLLPFFLTYDRLASRLSTVSTLPDLSALARSAMRETARRVVPITLVLAGFLWWAPAAPLSPGASPGRTPLPSETREAYRLLTLLALLGGGLVMGVARLLRGRGEAAPLLVENPETLVVAEEDLEPERLDDARYGPGRGRVILAYLRFVARAMERGHEIGASLTPREIERRLPAPAPTLDLLTTAFMDARYGPDEPSADGIRWAETASRELQAAVRHSGRRKARRGT